MTHRSRRRHFLPLNELAWRVNFDENPPNQSMGIVAFIKIGLLHCNLIQIQHGVVQALRMTQNASTLTNQAQVALGRHKLQLQVEKVLIGSANKTPGIAFINKCSIPEVLFTTNFQNLVVRWRDIEQFKHQRRVLLAVVSQWIQIPILTVENLQKSC